MNIQCSYCHALHWKAEALSHSTIADIKFGMCCYQGKIILPKLQEIPHDLFNLFTRTDDIGSAFRRKVLFYNNSLAMTSVGKKTDSSINNGRGPYSYVLRGELIHQAGSILPPEGLHPTYAQLYIHDNWGFTDVLDHRIAHHNQRNSNPQLHLDRNTLAILQGMLHQSHPAVHLYQQAFELTSTLPPDQRCQISLHFDPNSDARRYNLPNPNVNEIAVIVLGDGERITGSQDIIIYKKNQPGHPRSLFRISDSHPLYPLLRYVLLFPAGQMGWHPGIPQRQRENQANRNSRNTVSLEEYFRYRFHIRPTHVESNHLFLAGKLFQAYVCESWAVAEQKHLGQLATRQDDLRVELYQGLADAVVANVDTNLNDLGR